jgi:lipopolysaccharide transport system ATP-binding protein
MSNVALRMEHVYKKFRKGEIHNSLRDLLPALTGQMFRQKGLSEKRRDFWAVQDISFEAHKGEALGIIGPNGAGKSTILKLLSRIMKPTKGNMVVNGRLSALIEVSAGFHQDLTGRENIYLNGTILGMTKREIDGKLDQIITFSGIGEFIDTPVKRYSSGMYARLGFSVAAHVDPDVLIVDEVLSVGDYVFQQKCMKRMNEVITEGATVLFVSHNMKSVAEFCKRSLLLDHGKIVTSGPTQEVISSYLHRSDQSHNEVAASKKVVISRVTIRNEDGPCLQFQSGEKAWIDIELTASERCKSLSVSIYLTDEQNQSVFDTSTERLGHGNFTLDAGEMFFCTFELQLNLAMRIVHPCILVYRYDTQTEFDRWAPAATVYVSPSEGVAGIVDCFPQVSRHEIRPVSGSVLISTVRHRGDDNVQDSDW